MFCSKLFPQYPLSSVRGFFFLQKKRHAKIIASSTPTITLFLIQHTLFVDDIAESFDRDDEMFV